MIQGSRKPKNDEQVINENEKQISKCGNNDTSDMLEVYIDKTQVETLILACKYLVGQKIFRKYLVSLNCKCRKF